MNKIKAILAGAVIIILFLSVTGWMQGLTLNAFSDVGLDEQQTEKYIEENDGKIVEFLEENKFPHATGKSVEVYELKIEETQKTKLKVRIDWSEDSIEILDEESDTEATCEVVMPEKLYENAIEHVRTCIEDGQMEKKPELYTAIVSRTDVQIEDKGWIGQTSYKFNVARWFNRNYEGMKDQAPNSIVVPKKVII